MPLRTLNLLLVEPQSLIRSTVVSVARELRLPQIDETASVELASQRMARVRYDGLVLSLEDEARALLLLERLRTGQLASAPDLPVIVMSPGCSTELALRMKQLEVSRLLLKPFKVRTLLESIEAVAEQALQRMETT